MSVSEWKVVIGLEVHCQLKTATKMFTACPFHFGADPNSQTDPYTMGLPGVLPVPNGAAVESGIKLALAANCEIQRESRWARKHYFYPDLPKGYQITQSDRPYALEGWIEIPVEGSETETKRIRLERIHMEEDAGKNMHLVGDDVSLVDFNRAGAPLLEIVCRPDVRSASEAAAYVRELRTIIRYLDISDANMEEGTLRCDANVSIRRSDDAPFGTRCEIKNLNSFKFLELAIQAEVRRQVDILESGGKVIQSTLTYDTEKDQTRVTRTKEEAADYRYFPEPDMPPLVIEEAMIEHARASLPELPLARRRRYVETGLSPYDAGVLTSDPALAAFYDAVVEDAAKGAGGDAATRGALAKKACNWVTVELLGRLNADDKTIATSPVSPSHVAEILRLLEDGTISGRSAKDVFDKAYAEGASPAAIVEREGIRQVSDEGALRTVLAQILAENAKQLEQYRAGKTNLRGFFVGQAMKKTQGQANPGVVQKILDELLDGGAGTSGEGQGGA
jgi:aspartyl-tRNA(Asn)/glutamyl-tRNA(Gln) amidotransferase subunit B